MHYDSFLFPLLKIEPGESLSKTREAPIEKKKSQFMQESIRFDQESMATPFVFVVSFKC